MSKGRYLLFAFIYLSNLIFGQVCAKNSEDTVREYLLKAKVIHSISNFVTWPASAVSSNFNICILGENSELQQALLLFYSHEPVFKNKKINIYSTNLAKVDSCSIVFISQMPIMKLQNTMRELSNKPVLICSDNKGYAAKGVHVNLYVDNNKIRFEVNFEASKSAGIGFRSQLLRLAKIVKTQGELI